MSIERLRILLKGYIARELSSSEEKEFFSLIHTGLYVAELKELLQEEWPDEKTIFAADEERSERMLNYILREKSATLNPSHNNRFVIRRFSIAAAVLCFILASIFYLYRNRLSEPGLAVVPVNKVSQTADVAPGRNGALLRLANGSTIVLDSAANGIVSKEGNIVARKGGTEINYVQQGSVSAQNIFNTIETPRGRQFQLTLEDGTKVWLNAQSSIRFPVVFTGNNRSVEITGEVYFEVAENKAKPFIVHHRDMQIEVLGTHFNVNAYSDAPSVNTTLIEGRVKIKDGRDSGFLKPGQQARLSGSGHLSITERADIEEIMAWKNGRIAFSNAGLEEIMRQVSKWYDVDIVYAGPVPDRTFTADISRNTYLAEFLKVLELSNVRFNIEGRKLVVKP